MDFRCETRMRARFAETGLARSALHVSVERLSQEAANRLSVCATLAQVEAE